MTERAKEAPVVRRMFSSSPRDPRYHMLSYISQKFSKPSKTLEHEPRAALFLNRFSRTLTIMYATNGLADILGIPSNELCGKSFYYCIQENCLRDAVKCLESAKANDSIAYLRFWFRDPRQDNQAEHDEHMSDGHSSGDEDDGGVHLSELMDHDGTEVAVYSDSSNSLRSSVERDHTRNESLDPNSRTSSGNSTDLGANNDEAIFDRPEGAQQSRTSSISAPDEHNSSNGSWSRYPSQVELEAVVSCTSDGLVVVLRRAKPFVCHLPQPLGAAQEPYANGYFASPWASDPILPNSYNHAMYPLPHLQQPAAAPVQPTAAGANMAASRGPAAEDFMNSIREVAVFAWALTGINGSLEQYSRGTPSGESQPPGGLPIWDSDSNAGLVVDRPVGSAYITNGPSNGQNGQYESNGNHHAIAGHNFNDQTQSNGFAYQSNGYGGPHHHPDSNSHYIPYNPSLNHHENSSNSHGYDHVNGTQYTNSSQYSKSNGYHDSAAMNGWTPPGEQPRVWEVSQQIGQGTNAMNGYQDEGRTFG